MRVGAAWDVLGMIALLLPLAGALLPRAGAGGAPDTVVAGRWGALLAAATWTGMVAVGARPTIGAFDPEPLAVGAMAGTALLAATLTSGGPAGPGRDPRTVAPPAAALVGLLLGTIDAPERLGSPGAVTAGVLLATVVAVVVVLAADSGRLTRSPLVLVLLPAALVVVLRAERSVPGGHLDGLPALAGTVLAVVAAAATWAPPRWSATTAAVGPLLVAAAALSPLGPARAGAGLLAAAAVLHAVVPMRWVLVTYAPGLAVLVVAAADVPAPDDPGPAHPLWAIGVAAVAVGMVVRTEPLAARRRWRPTVEVQVATGALAAWLLVAPGRWHWAGAPVDALAAWERAAAVGGAILLGAATLAAALPLAPRLPVGPGRATDRKPEPQAG